MAEPWSSIAWLALGIARIVVTFVGLWLALAGRWERFVVAVGVNVALFGGLTFAERVGLIASQEAERAEARKELLRRPGESRTRFFLRRFLRELFLQ